VLQTGEYFGEMVTLGRASARQLRLPHRRRTASSARAAAGQQELPAVTDDRPAALGVDRLALSNERLTKVVT
jgi:hypothetical protein